LTTVLGHDGGPVEKQADEPQQDADDKVEQAPHGLPYWMGGGEPNLELFPKQRGAPLAKIKLQQLIRLISVARLV
jgi:hypothetical protein